jgi:hypothetical protein
MVDNHMIAAVQIDKRLFFLDATDPDLPFGMPSAMIQGKEALIGKSRHSYEIRTVPIVEARHNVLQDSAVVMLAPADTISVTGSISGSGYFKSELHNRQPLFNGRNITTEVWQAQPVLSDTAKQVRYGYTAHHAMIHQNQQIFFNPHTITARYQEKWLPTAVPFNHWELEYAFTLIHKQFIKLPEGWEVAFLPPDTDSLHPDFGFSVRYEKKTDGIMIVRTIFVNSLSITADSIAAWQKFAESYNIAIRQNIIFNPINK